MKRVILPLFVAVAVIAAATIVFAVAGGALGNSEAASATQPAGKQAAAGDAAGGTTPGPGVAVTPEELRAVGLSPVKPGTRLIDFELEDLNGKKVKLSSLGGRVVFLNFWATWCPPCRAEMPSMERLHAKLGDKGLYILSVDLQEGKREVQAFMSELKLTFPVVLDRAGSAAAAYGVRSIPTTYLIGRDGTIIAGRIGGQEWDDPTIVAFFEKLLAR